VNPTQLDRPYRLSQAVMDKVDKEAAKYPSRRAAVKSALRYCQEETGWVSNGVVTAVATHLGLEPIEVYEVATFYDMFYTEPGGRHRIRVCTNVSCMLRGAETIVNHLKDKLGVKVGETSPDGRITLLEAECLGACGGAPMLVCGNQYFENLTTDKLDSLLDQLD
jgi:NADH-quinone oxidoreductase subunit E